MATYLSQAKLTCYKKANTDMFTLIIVEKNFFFIVLPSPHPLSC